MQIEQKELDRYLGHIIIVQRKYFNIVHMKKEDSF